MNSKKPRFVRQRIHTKKKLEEKWRRPKGLQSKLRLQKGGHGVLVKVGYRTSKDKRGSIKGLQPVIVSQKKDLESIDSKTQAIIISSNVGLRNKKVIIKEAESKGLLILNWKDPSSWLSKKTAILESSKKEKDKKKKIQEEKKKSDKKKDIEETVSEEEKKEKDKKELDKVLTKKQ